MLLANQPGYLSAPILQAPNTDSQKTSADTPEKKSPARLRSHGLAGLHSMAIRIFPERRIVYLILLAMAITLEFLLPLPAAANDFPSLDGLGSMTCAGNQSSGVNINATTYNPPVTTLNVYRLTSSIQPGAGPGIGLTNGTYNGGPLNATINSGDTESNTVINVIGSYGITAQSQGSTGSNGSDADLLHHSSAGGSGYNSGSVTVNTNGTTASDSITTTGQSAVGILAISQAGNGGTGGGGSIWFDGSNGGGGGNAGSVMVGGSGTISTSDPNSHGILVTSAGGNGGDGGDGTWFSSGAAGCNGGLGGSATVAGNWNIATGEAGAYGIWAQSVGGNAGAGGSGGWIAASGGGGGAAADGGTVSVTSGGLITASGNDSYGILAQSVGGFGGQGGAASGLFYARGGDGNSAGSGGNVDVINQPGGSITTLGNGACAIRAQSIGGGGGTGGGGGAIVGLGGTGGSGGNAGDVTVTNNALLQTVGQSAHAILAQSIGGGGGSAGSEGGVVAIGGSGSGGGV